MYWCQRLRAFWRVKENRNTAYFHALSAQKGKLNLIRALHDEEGSWHRDAAVIHEVAIKFYTTLFAAQGGNNDFFNRSIVTHQIDRRAVELMDSNSIEGDQTESILYGWYQGTWTRRYASYFLSALLGYSRARFV
ncbi:hypothetical protein LIER_09297 [Lithospermum erythrorhizon]|uniref:Uncharacterized protein n=1 Tax=Lithospermum erythrorhizon TaxID=34254 RepID=A0AAV3PI20_LITER